MTDPVVGQSSEAGGQTEREWLEGLDARTEQERRLGAELEATWVGVKVQAEAAETRIRELEAALREIAKRRQGIGQGLAAEFQLLARNALSQATKREGPPPPPPPRHRPDKMPIRATKAREVELGGMIHVFKCPCNIPPGRWVDVTIRGEWATWRYSVRDWRFLWLRRREVSKVVRATKREDG